MGVTIREVAEAAGVSVATVSRALHGMSVISQKTRDHVSQIAKEMGYSFTDLIGVEVKTTRAPAVAKYRHPENAALTWSGRGRKPQWFADHINAGKDPSALAV